MIEYTGHCPRNVSEDAKYVVRHSRAGHSFGQEQRFAVGITYRTADDEVWYPSTSEHPELISMVNEIKERTAFAPGGAFYINEHKQVLVPGGDDRKYYLAGEYHEPIVFMFEGNRISGLAIDENNAPLTPGSVWSGPHVGIPYILKAGGDDIFYRAELRPNVHKELFLSKSIGVEAAKRVSGKIAKIKGSGGGRIYVNEHCHIFTPRSGTYGLEYIYIGCIDLNEWFSKVQ